MSQNFQYTANSLTDIAEQFRRMAEACDGRAGGATGTRRLCRQAEARVWRDAAEYLDQTKIVLPEHIGEPQS